MEILDSRFCVGAILFGFDSVYNQLRRRLRNNDLACRFWLLSLVTSGEEEMQWDWE